MNDIGDYSVELSINEPCEQVVAAERAEGDPFISYLIVMAFTCICMSAYVSGSAGYNFPIAMIWPLPLFFVIALPVVCIWKNTYSIETGHVYLNVLVNGFIGLVYYLSILVVLEPVNRLMGTYWWHFSHPPLG